MDAPISYTLWPSLYAVDHPQAVSETWPEIAERFHQHIRLIDKTRAPGFGPYVLASPHRRDDCVKEVTMAVFDVDTGTKDQFDKLEASLDTGSLSYIWYSTFSNSPETPAYRLILPLSRPIAPEVWPRLRTYLIEGFNIPTDAQKCTAASHFYFAPSAPLHAKEPVYYWAHRQPVDVDSIAKDLKPDLVPSSKPRPRRPALDDWEPPPDDTPYDLDAMRAILERRAVALDKGKTRDKAELLRRLLEGRQLDEKGSRNYTTNRVVSLVAFTLPPVLPLRAYHEIFAASLAAMEADGSKLREHILEAMFLRAMKARTAAEAADAEFKEHLERRFASRRTNK